MNRSMPQYRARTLISLVAAASAVVALPGPALSETSGSALSLARELNRAFVEVADRVSASVVVISVAHKPSHMDLEDQDNPFFEMLPPQFKKQLEDQRQKKKESKEDSSNEKPIVDGQGSGIIIRKEGYILTNRHVVEGADEIKVRFKDGSQFVAEVRGVDAQADVAVLKIDPKDKKLIPATLGDSEKTRVGEFAIAIGAPYELDYSVTFGHVSAKGRTVLSDRRLDQDFLQTDANINPGNSGGPLVNIEGEVIGINTLIRGLHTGIGFAIPINLGREVAEQLIAEGKYTRSWLGVGVRALTDDADLKELIAGISEGVVVTLIQGDGPAFKSDLKPSDVITAVDGKKVASAQELKNEVRSKKIGQSVTLDVYRMVDASHGKSIKVKLNTAAMPEKILEVASRPAPVQEEQTRSFGLTVKSLTRELADQYGVEKAEGVIVTEVQTGSAAESKGIRPGDIITEINLKPVKTAKQFRDAIKSADLKKGIILNFTSRGTSKFEFLKESGE